MCALINVQDSRFSLILDRSLRRRMKLYELAEKVWYCSYGLEHITNQYKALKYNNQNKRKKLMNLLLDIILGILFCIIFTYTTSIQDIIDYILMRIANVRSYLEDLITWLMGAPAGLKLNQELSSFLGNFFLYHVYIWMGYLMFVEQYIASVMGIIFYSSCLGLSLFLSLVNDLVNVLTFHVYCFYVYAAKLYSFQLQGLLSLARLFMGK